MEQKQAAHLVEEHLKTIYTYAMSRVANKADAEDLAGDILLAVLRGADSMRDDNAFYGYLWATARNTYKKYLQKKKTRRCTGLDESLASDDPDIADVLFEREEINRLRRELAILSKEHRECTVAYYIDGLSCADISEKRGISLEMVKYYLFKTRKLLKEGIGMERTFGEKSYNPSVFEFNTIFSGQFNREYRNLFNRRLPGNILVSTYYTPMTVRELVMELGVAAVYLEDEIALLEKYGLLTALPGGKYQTHLVIYTEAYQNEFRKAVCAALTDTVGDILRSIKQKLLQVRDIGFPGAEYDDGHLLWSFLFHLMREGFELFEMSHPKAERSTQLYDGATGTNYGVDYREAPDAWSCDAFAGYAGLSDACFATFANFGILPAQNHFNMDGNLSTSPRFTRVQLEALDALLREEIHMFSNLYDVLAACAVRIMREHAPRAVGHMVEEVILQTVFFRTVGIIGALAVHSGEMTIPDDPNVRPMIVCDFALTEAGISGKEI